MKRFNHYLLTHKPWLWETKLISFGFIALGYICINQLVINTLAIDHYFMHVIVTGLISISLLIVWILKLSRFNSLKTFGKTSPQTAQIQFLTYLSISVALFYPHFTSYFYQDYFQIVKPYALGLLMYPSFFTAIFIFMAKCTGFVKIIAYLSTLLLVELFFYGFSFYLNSIGIGSFISVLSIIGLLASVFFLYIQFQSKSLATKLKASVFLTSCALLFLYLSVPIIVHIASNWIFCQYLSAYFSFNLSLLVSFLSFIGCLLPKTHIIFISNITHNN